MTAAAGVEARTGTRAVLSADLSGNGYPDLVLCGDLLAPMRVLFNRGDGTFFDDTLASGLVGSGRNVSAHAADVNGDGWLDVYIAAGVIPSENFPNTLFRNNGDGTFTDVSVPAGVATANGACAATFIHLDDGDDIDLVVANCGGDGGVNLPFEVYDNQGNGTFVDRMEDSRVWGQGHWMGLAVLDHDADLRLDFFATNSGIGREQPHALYRNDGDGTFTDVGPTAGVSDWEFGWGTSAADFDNDGAVDLYYTGRSQVGDLYASPGHLFRNLGDGTFAAPSQPLDLSSSWTSGVAAGDLDQDGAVDLAIVRTSMPDHGETGHAVLLRNLGSDNHWLTVRPRGQAPNTGAVGARIVAEVDGRFQIREVHAGSSYQSTNSPWPTFGLADATTASLCVRWPTGDQEAFGPFDADGVVDVVQGSGQTAVCATVQGPGGTDTGPLGGPGPDDPSCGCRGPNAAGGLGLLVVSILLRRRVS